MNRIRTYIFLFLAVLVSALAVGYTFTNLVEFSGFAAGLLKAVIGIGLFVAFDRFVMRDLDTLAELKKGNIAYALFLVAFALIVSATIATAQAPPDYDHPVDSADFYPAHLDTALSYRGTVEYKSNTGPDIDRFLAVVGLPAGNPYCAAFVSFALEAPDPGPDRPQVRSGLATHFITETSIDAKYVLRGTADIKPGDILIWRKGNSIYGHTGFVIHWQGGHGTTIEANTSSGRYGNQREGDGVWKRRRAIQPGNYFRITHFTKVIYHG